MKRLSRDDIRDLKRRLAEWHTPQAMQGLVATVEDEIFFVQSGLAFLRDAWIGAELGRHRKANKVRLISDNWPDFELLINGHSEAFEAVELDDPDRRRSDEYRRSRKSKDDPIENWIYRSEKLPEWLDKIIMKKIDKRYSGSVGLAIYINVTDWGIRHSEIVAGFASATEAAKDTFETVWIIWKDRAYQVWPNPPTSHIA